MIHRPSGSNPRCCLYEVDHATRGSSSFQIFSRDSLIRRRLRSAHLTSGGQLKKQNLTGAQNLMAAQLLTDSKYEDSISILRGENRVHADVYATQRVVLGGDGSAKSKRSLITVFSQLYLDGGLHSNSSSHPPVEPIDGLKQVSAIEGWYAPHAAA